MTWVVGGAGVWHPFVAGDVRVTWGPRGRSLDCLQKVHLVAPNLLCGFAGSVKIGFKVVDDLRAQIAASASLRRLAHTWLPRRLRRTFRGSSANDRRQRCHILMAGYHPSLELIPGWPQTDAFRFCSPDFEPEYLRSDKCGGIGVGNAVERLRLLAQSTYTAFSSVRMNATTPWLLGHMMANQLRREIATTPSPGISEWFVFGTVTPRGAYLEPFSCEVREAGKRRRLAAPPVATTYDELKNIAHANGLHASAAVA